MKSTLFGSVSHAINRWGVMHHRRLTVPIIFRLLGLKKWVVVIIHDDGPTQ